MAPKYAIAHEPLHNDVSKSGNKSPNHLKPARSTLVCKARNFSRSACKTAALSAHARSKGLI